jgi:hypothetical protein
MSSELGKTPSVSSKEACIPPSMTKLQDFLTLTRGFLNQLARDKLAERPKRWSLCQIRQKSAWATKPRPPALQLQRPSDHGPCPRGQSDPPPPSFVLLPSSTVDNLLPGGFKLMRSIKIAPNQDRRSKSFRWPKCAEDNRFCNAERDHRD